MNVANGSRPPIDTADARACVALISGLPLTNAREAHQALVTLLTGLAHRPPAPAAYLDMLEAARAPLAFLQDELAQRYAGKPLPPTPAESEAFRHVLSLWQAAARAYAQVAQLGAGDARVQAQLALICHRCVHYAGQVVLESFRARREPTPGAWIDLHGYYATAEEWGIDKTTVPEPLGESRKLQSAAEAYAAILLADLASPYSRGAHEFGWIMRWARNFAPLTAIRRAGENIGGHAFGVDLMHDASARPLERMAPSDSLRHFDTTQLAPKLQDILARLKLHETPAALGLGDNCPAATASRLLLQLYKPWCLNATPRRWKRRGAQGIAQACLGFEPIHFHVSGEEFNQPEHVRMYSRGDMDRIWTFRDQVDPTQLSVRASQVQIAYPLERWSVADQSVSGFRLMRGEAGARIEHGQLFCLKPPDGEHFLLAQVSWNLMQKDDLLIGIHVLPGIPQGIAVRPTGLQVSPSERYVRAFLLPTVPALREEPSLVLPRGWFQAERVIELYTDRAVKVRLGLLMAQGADFDRATFTRL
ncbi:MAG: hypothetical protein FJY34_00490 [Betaproteobacteria bacterium]|nr:hypothetical protein [Betaproteobacteria bacterium]